MTVDEQGSVAIRTPDQRLRVFVSSVSAKRSHSYALHKTGASTNAEGPRRLNNHHPGNGGPVRKLGR
jgi:hypothetical protein